MKRERKTLDLPSGASVTIWPASLLVMGECAQCETPFDSARVMISRCTGDLVFMHDNRETRYEIVAKAPDKCGANEISIDELDPDDQTMLSEEIQAISTLLKKGGKAEADTKSETQADTPGEKGDAN